MTKIGFIRHGSTAWNKERRAQGSADIPLDEDGIIQANKLAERLSMENWDVIYSSDLLRARQTAEIISERMGNKQIVLEPRIREVSGGQIEGTIESERIAKWGHNWRELDLGMEDVESVIKRTVPFIQEIQEKHENMNILIVSHGACIQCLIQELVPQVEFEGHLKNTSITELNKTSNGWTCNLYNCAKHLDS